MGQIKQPLPSGLRVFGNNDTSTQVTFQQRKRYRDDVFPALSPQAFFDFWGADRYVGRISTTGNSVMVRGDNLKPLQFSEGTLFALNFVADAWRDFAEKIRELQRREVLYSQSPYANMVARQAWQAPTNDYHEYMSSEVYPVFANVFMSNFSNQKRLRDLDSFFSLFTDFCNLVVGEGGPVTRSGYLESTYTSVMNTGLAIEIAIDNHADDFRKVSEFLKDENFELVATIASHYGFLIDKNAPWRFVANVASAAMQEYMVGVFMFSPYIDFTNGYGVCKDPIINDRRPAEPYGFSTIPGLAHVVRHAPGYDPYVDLIRDRSQMTTYQMLFKVAYDETWATDIGLLKLYLLDFYNRYVTDNPEFVEYNHKFREIAETLCSESPNIVTSRHLLDEETIDSSIGDFRDRWSLKAFYVLRLLERDIKKPIKERRADLKDIFNIYTLSSGTPLQKYWNALRHIQDEIIGPITTRDLTIRTVGDIKKG